ncbi:MAG TPA: Bax inhibitor-1/YccA family protein [Xanthobacteraceae bacterium]
MSDFDRNYAAVRGAGADRALAIDAGLRAYMIRVYNTMAAGVALTGVIAWLTFQAAVVTNDADAIVGLTAFGQAIFGGPAVLLLVLGTLGLVFFLSFRVHRLQVGTALTLFMVYAALLGLMLSSVFLAYTGASITRVFFISATAFGALSLWGYTTQRDLSPVGSFLLMGLFGLILAALVNLFLKSTGLDFVISAIGVLVFAGLTAWDTQRIKEMFDPQEDGTATGRKAVMGALSLYLDFINLFLFMLRFLGDRR